jgi:maleate cis-trans isomerase
MSLDPRRGPKIGVLVPFTNCNLEPDLALMRPDGATLHFERLGGYDAEAIPGREQMAGLGASSLDEPLRLIAGVRPRAVLYGCTSATLTHGLAFDRQLAGEIERRVGAVSITAAGALLEGLSALGAARVAFSSPYVGEINNQAVAFLESAGHQVVSRADIGRDLGNYGQGELTPEDVMALAKRADHPEAQALVLSCTDMRAVEAVSAIEAALGKPVVTSNQAMIFALCRALDLARPPGAPGLLFERL